MCGRAEVTTVALPFFKQMFFYCCFIHGGYMDGKKSNELNALALTALLEAGYLVRGETLVDAEDGVEPYDGLVEGAVIECARRLSSRTYASDGYIKNVDSMRTLLAAALEDVKTGIAEMQEALVRESEDWSKRTTNGAGESLPLLLGLARSPLGDPARYQMEGKSNSAALRGLLDDWIAIWWAAARSAWWRQAVSMSVRRAIAGNGSALDETLIAAR
jgi:hypothetical protein